MALSSKPAPIMIIVRLESTTSCICVPRLAVVFGTNKTFQNHRKPNGNFPFAAFFQSSASLYLLNFLMHSYLLSSPERDLGFIRFLTSFYPMPYVQSPVKVILRCKQIRTMPHLQELFRIQALTTTEGLRHNLGPSFFILHVLSRTFNH